jgi:hypothetical protein
VLVKASHSIGLEALALALAAETGAGARNGAAR